MSNKKHLRETTLQRLAQLPSDVLPLASEKICKRVTDTTMLKELFIQANYIALFAASKREIDLAALHELWIGKKFVYPLCQPNHQMTFHHVHSQSELVTGKYGISEPSAERHPKVDIERIDLFFCPGIAFGKDGSRLGQGGGYYDRALGEKVNSQKKFCGVALEEQVHDTLPSEAHDIRMHFVVTEKDLHIPDLT
ncbi:MAG: 5-formyltetrahydrofolate cyclo-ligase [Akkermansiaceae bacterium]